MQKRKNDTPFMEPSYYAILPAFIRYSNKLSANEKLLYAEITTLSNKRGYCWASNGYFSELFKVDNRTVRRWISGLAKQGFVFVTTNTDGVRCIAINEEGTKVPTLLDKNVLPPGQKCPTPPDKNAHHNNTSSNSKINKIQTLSPDDLIIWQKFLEWQEKTAPRVAEMKEPLLPEELLKLLKVHGKDLMKEVFEAMHNTSKLNSKDGYVSAYKTCNNWCKLRKNNNKPSTGGAAPGKVVARQLKNLPPLTGYNARFAAWYDMQTHPLWAIADQYGNIDHTKPGLLPGIKIVGWNKGINPVFGNELFAAFEDGSLQPLGEGQRTQYQTQGGMFKAASIRKGLIY